MADTGSTAGTAGQSALWLLAYDCGSTNLKAALFDRDQVRVAEETAKVAYSCSESGCVEMDARGFLESARELRQALCGAVGIDTAAVTRVAMTSQAQTFTVVDGHGRALCPLFSWLDKRAQEEAREIAARFGAEFHEHCSFSRPVAQLQACKVLWLRRREPALLRRGHRIACLPGYLALALGADNVTDANLAAMGGLYSLKSGGWWPQMTEYCGVTGLLPTLIDPATAVGNVAMAGNDQTAGAVANGCTEGETVVTLGTALVAYRRAGSEPGPYSAGGCWGPYPRGGYYELATVDEGGLALDWACAALDVSGGAQAFLALAESASAARPAGSGEGGCCLFYPERCGTGSAWVGDGPSGARAGAVVEGITFTLRVLLEEDLGLDLKTQRLCVIGGGSRSRFWCQLIADALQCPVRRGSGDALLGAALLGTQSAAPARSETGSEFVPAPARARGLRQRYRAWQQQHERPQAGL